MIVAQRKPLDELIAKLQNHARVMVAGCATCVAECHAGGQKETEILASQLRLAFREKRMPVEVLECCIERQCEPEMIETQAAKLADCEAILSLACGVGVQELAQRFPDKAVYPGLNTTFMGTHASGQVWEERCAGCGNCVLDLTAGICPVSRCSKSMLNGPCGGTTREGKCEIAGETPCAWAEIAKRLRERGQLNQMRTIIPAKDWSTARDGGPRKLVREEVES